MSRIRTVIVGTAGHIDHGKSALVQALTGIHPDRLAEERERGMTIDLGFAPYGHSSGATVGMIDVPGHERFIKNMVAGATSIDVAVLVVAADDGVMPQTREHLAILQLLGVRRGLVALNKIDLVEPELAELAAEELRDLLAETFLSDAPVLPVSAVTGQGVDELRTALDELITQAEPHDGGGAFRMPVQRVFSVKGHGLVVTGVPLSGHAEVGSALEIVRTGAPVRVRSVHAYGEQRETGTAGHSTALNLVGATHDEVHRGDVVAEPETCREARFLALAYDHVSESMALRTRHPVRAHAGTAEVLGRAIVLDGDLAVAGESARVQLRLDEAVACAAGDRILLRDASSMEVLGGGTVLALTEGRLKRGKERVLTDLRAREDALGDPVAMVTALLAGAGTRGMPLDELARETGLELATLNEQLQPAIDEAELVIVGRLALTAQAIAAVADDVVAALRSAHRKRPLLDWLDQSAVCAPLDHSLPVLKAAVVHDDRLESGPGGKLRRRGHRGRLGPKLVEARNAVLDALLAGGPKPPTIDGELTGLDDADSNALLEHLREEGEIVAVGPVLFHRDALARMRQTVVEHGRANGDEIDIPTLRDALGTTRKFLMPFLEALDAEGVTVRHGDRRVLRRSS